MTPRERVDAAFSHRRPDRTPIFEYVLLPPLSARILGRPMEEYLGGMEPWLESARTSGFEHALRAYARDRVEVAGKLGHDMLFVSPNPVPGAAYSYDPLSELGAQFTVQQEGDPVRRLEERNRRVTETMLGDLPQDSYLVYHLLREEMARRDMDLPILAPAYFHGIWTDSDLMQVMLIEPEVAREHFRLATRRAMAVIADYGRIGVEMMGIGGDFAGHGCSFRRRRTGTSSCRRSGRALSASARSGPGPSTRPTATCGRSSTTSFPAAASTRTWRSTWAPGWNVPAEGPVRGTIHLPGQHGLRQDPELLHSAGDRAVTRRIIEDGGGAGGHIFTASNAITASVPPETTLPW